MARRMPVGTIRQWSQGAVIKAHDGSVFGNGWYPLSTSTTLEEIGMTCDRAANNMIHKKVPINGEKFLDHEIEVFEDEQGNKKYTPDDFKKYEGFAGAARYSFRNEFSRRYMKPKLDAYDQINEELKRLNEDKGYRLGKGSEEIQKENYLSREEIREVKDRIRGEIKHDDSYFTVAEANELKGIVMRTKTQLDKGVDFEGNEKKVYDKAIAVASAIPEKYERLDLVRAKVKEQKDAIGETFSDNWGVRESYNDFVDDKYSEYFQKFKEQIFVDEGKRQEELFGVRIDEPDTDKFYQALGKKLAGLTQEQIEEKYPFKEMVEMRFEALYSKQVKGDWTYETLGALYKIEKAIDYLPAGHVLTNSELKSITNVNYSGGPHGGYAWYSPDEKRINLSDNMMSSSSVWGRMDDTNEFNSTLYHEIGHSVSQKLGRDNSLAYKRFVKECGWSFQQAHYREGMFMSTAGAKDVPREGSRQNVPLLTEYAHKSPEEAFAEYYSLYATNKPEIDAWLKTGDSKHLEKKTFFGANNLFKGGDETVASTIPHRTTMEPAIRQHVEKAIVESKLDIDNHIKMDLINPWHSKVHPHDQPNYNPREKVRFRKNWDFEKMPPVIAIGDKSRFEILDGSNRREQAKMNKKQLPAITVSKEMHTQLTRRGVHNDDIISYAYYINTNTKIPKPTEKPRKISGMDYRGSIIDAEKIKLSKNIFRRMQDIYDSEELAKALQEINLG